VLDVLDVQKVLASQLQCHPEGKKIETNFLM
jgi:hypothetical protein